VHQCLRSCTAVLIPSRSVWPCAAGADSADGQLQIELPAALQKQLLDQYDAIHDDNKLLQLPRRPTVMQVGNAVHACNKQTGWRSATVGTRSRGRGGLQYMLVGQFSKDCR
jgi:hypothetical protein